MKKIFLFIVIASLAIEAGSQSVIGRWRTHMAYNNVNQIAQSDLKIYAVSEGSLFSVSKADGDIEFYSKMSGLNDANISQIEFDRINDQLLIIYGNGNIDIMNKAGVTNIPDLYRKQMSSSKGINEVSFYQNLAYLSCDFGILLINMDKKEIVDTYIIGQGGTETKVVSTALHNNRIYAITENKLLSADATRPLLLVNFEYWSEVQQLPGSGEISKVISFAGKMLLLRGGRIYHTSDGVSWKEINDAPTATKIALSRNHMVIYNQSNTVTLLNEQLSLSSHPIISAQDIEYDSDNNLFWIAAVEHGVVSAKSTGGAPELSYYKPKGPANNFPYFMTFAGDKLFMVPGGRLTDVFNRPGVVMIYQNGQWRNLFASDFHSQLQQEVPGQFVVDYVNVAVNPSDPTHFFVTSFGNGLFEYRNDQFYKWHHHNNSPLVNVISTIPYVYLRLDGAIFDNEGNLWLCNMFDANAIKILTKEGQWKTLNYPNSNHPTLGNILINNQNPRQKWANSVRYSQGLLIWDDNGTLDDQSDDKSVFLNKFPDVDNVGSELRPTFFYSMAQDKNGVVWVGTDIGPLLFYNTSRAFEPGYTCSRVKIPRNDGTNQADYLLKDEVVQAIAIDGANRKWIATRTSGVYLMSENGQETIRHFTSSNSPLLSDNVISISINPVTGEVFFGTSNGLISYQSDASEGTGAYDNVYAYPNPVRENYNGIITITGLINNTQVKITDISGNLVYQTVSNGSLATWDGKDVHGRKVSTGVYMAICASEDGTQSTITKIMVIN
ncbi:MAG: two-component regulator propeller domain-containing protein [Paludibacter sp.]|jgi:hypothetical protein|nr:two-component regulator propeller domain-containing protein [Paludibacter sp.]